MNARGVKRPIQVKHPLKPIFECFIVLLSIRSTRSWWSRALKFRLLVLFFYRRNIYINICSPMKTVLQRHYQCYSLYPSVLWEYIVMQFKIYKLCNFLYLQAQCFLCFFFFFHASGSSRSADSYTTAFKTTSPPSPVGI